ncbi:50S ribosomal protein L9 [Linum grandiflorum]
MAYLQHGRSGLRQVLRGSNVKISSDSALPPLIYVCQGIRFRKLDVILTSNVEKLGKAGETVKVAPGYFRNHLMPKLLAVPNLDKFAHLIREQRKLYQQEEEEEVKVVDETKEDQMKEFETAAKRLDKSRVVCSILSLDIALVLDVCYLLQYSDSPVLQTFRVGIDSQKFKARASKDEPIIIRAPVTKDDIVKEVARQLNVLIDPENLHLPTPLTTFGEYEVPMRLPRSIPLPEAKVNWTLTVKIRGK